VARDPDPRDRRKNAVRVTPQGTATLNRCLKLAEQANSELLSLLSTTECGQFISLLTLLQAAGTRQPPQLRFQLVDDATIEDWRYVHNTIIPTDPLSIEDVRERAQRNHLEVAYVHDLVVGCSTVRPPADEDPAATVIVRVLPEHRRLGYGTEFYERELEHAGTRDVQTVVLASNEDGLRFALTRGFVEIERYVLPGGTTPYIDLRMRRT
jgi:GNAT superfamily N-acetyltransferase